MAAQALYRKWSPQTFDAMVGQAHVTRTLRNALRSDRVGHAYLFAGPRGTGKTTTARLLAKAVNCLTEDPGARPCNACTICQALTEGRLLDLIEIDAASNRGIDEIRQLRERVGFRPNEARYKVYVIHEVHMLTEPAFNALLKTLEEPPPHVIFVLATTEPHKIPKTILSRCQRFDFRRLSVEEIVGRLADLAEREGQPFEPEALTAIARHGAGSIRDAESLLDQLMAYRNETITLEQVQAVLGTGALEVVSDLVGHLIVGDAARGLDAVNRAIDGGVAPGQLNRQIVEYLRGLMLILVGDGDQLLNLPAETLDQMRGAAERISLRKTVRALRLFNEAGRALKGSLHPQLPLELAFIEAAVPEQMAGESSPPKTTTNAPEPIASSKPAGVSEKKAQSAASTAGPSTSDPAGGPREVAEGQVSLAALQRHWARILKAVRPKSHSVEALLKSGHPESVSGDTVVIGFEHQFHKGKVEQAENRRLVEDAIHETLGHRCRVTCALVSELRGRPAPTETRSSSASEPRGDVTEDPVIQTAVEELGARVVNVSDNA
jgi:DNA polymerase-3 subunit gamma/tau